MKTMKMARKKCAESWIEKFLKYGHGQYHMSKLSNSGIDLKAELSRMSEKQLRLLNSLIASSYSTGCAETREWYNEHRKEEQE